ncbi:DUF1501 domain-containing protein [Pseudooceanicola sp. C21-150M6]|uniref:DUF1501 domain-containing protein n=1 Tax=Pseudooceanicola sp. C21-150M6 TaxID=3434355 RepID=UPI003D7FFDA7
MSDQSLSRRSFLTRSLALGCSAAASPWLAPVTMASAPWDTRLVVIILRGAMDGLGVLQPWGDRNFAALRPDVPTIGAPNGGVDLDGYHGLHPAMAPLLPMWRAGELGFVNAVSTPYRDKRSHFDGQDILEAGIADMNQPIRDGWLNRLLQAVPGVEADTAYTIGSSGMLLTKGRAPVAEWSPQSVLAMSPQAQRLMEHVMHDDPLFRGALAEALDLSEGQEASAMMSGDDGSMMSGMAAVRQGAQVARDNAGPIHVAKFAAERLREDARIAAFSINGWDTHNNQQAAIARPLGALVETLTTLRQDLGPVWQRTGVIAMTEFGRTARLNGTRGTDHGTGGTLIFAGGALRGGQVHGRWPGLTEADLYERRDLMPTSDVRAQAGLVMQGLFGLDRSVIEQVVFPGVQMEGAARLVL